MAIVVLLGTEKSVILSWKFEGLWRNSVCFDNTGFVPKIVATKLHNIKHNLTQILQIQKRDCLLSYCFFVNYFEAQSLERSVFFLYSKNLL